MSNPLILHCKKCVQDTLANGTPHKSLYRCIMMDGDLYIMCEDHREPVVIYENVSPITDAACDLCQLEEVKLT